MTEKRSDNNLVDGKYNIEDLVDIKRLQGIFEKFTQVTGFTIGFLDHPGLHILCATGWRDICTRFHRGCPVSAENCTKSNRHLLDQLKEQGQLVIEACENGLVDCATPIIIKGSHIASLATGQLLLERPDLERFKRQAKLFGYDEQNYLRALQEVPVVSEEQLRNVTAFLGELASIISELGYASLEIKEKNIQLEEDLRERKRIEEFKDNILQNVTHELRTPLHAMREGIELLVQDFKEKNAGNQEEILKITRSNLSRLVRLVNHFLNFQKLEAGMVTLHLQKSSLNRIADDAAKMIGPVAVAKKLAVELRLDPGIPEVLCDPDRIMEVIINLLDNAVKFTEKGAIIVTSSLRGNKVVISVEDHGVGIRSEDIDKLFGKFVQLKERTAVAVTGTGLGLAISKNIMALHHSTISVTSEYGKGSIFSFELPVAAG